MYGYYKNVYGYWKYDDVIGLGCGVDKYDLVYVYKVSKEMAHAVNEKGKIIKFHITYITKNSFIRPSYKYHKKCKLKVSNCRKCRMYKFKQTLKRFRIKLKNKIRKECEYSQKNRDEEYECSLTSSEGWLLKCPKGRKC